MVKEMDIEIDKEKKINKKKEWIGLIVGYIGTLAGLFGIIWINQNVLMALPLVGRMIVMIASRILLMIVPILLMIICKDKLSDYGFTRKRLGLQIALGILLGLAMSIVLTLIPFLFGFGKYLGNDNGRYYTELWQFAYDFLYLTVGVSLSEEFVFRGFIYEKIKRISGRDSITVIVSSFMFGLLHLFGGNIIQVIVTSFMGILFCLIRQKIRNCSLLTVIIVHGIYDAMITVWTAVFMV